MKEVKVIVKTAKTKDGKKEFPTYRAVTKTGHLIQLKFTKDVKDLPTATCFMLVEPENYNVQKNTEYPTMWVKKVEGYKPFERVTTEEDLF